MKYNIGDKVKVVNYGSIIWSNDIRFGWVGEKDIMPELVGQIGVIDGVGFDNKSYSIMGIEGKHAWYNEDQLEMVSQNQNNIK